MERVREWAGANEPVVLFELAEVLAIEAEAASTPTALPDIVRSWDTTYDTVIHKGLMAYAVEDAWDASVSPVGDPADGIEQHDLGELAHGIIRSLLQRLAEKPEPEAQP